MLWYVHGSYANALVRGKHRYLVPDIDATRGPGEDPDQAIARPPRPTVSWPDSVSIYSAEQLRADPPDVVVCQRLEEIPWVERLFGDRLGRTIKAVFLEHNVPRNQLPAAPHPLADRPGWRVVQVTYVNDLMWDCGRTPTVVVPHGIVDPGYQYLGDRARAAFVANEPGRRSRVTGADLLPAVLGDAGADCYGIDADRFVAEQVGSHHGLDLEFGGNLAPGELNERWRHNRVHLHLTRWTSLGLSLLEAMHLGLPVIALATTEAATLPPEIGAVSSDVDVLRRRTAELLADREQARACGRAARTVALERFGLEPFLRRWDAVYAG